MPVGPLIRRAFGPYERQVADLWRSVFIDLDAWADQIAAWAPAAERILEVGCGEGAMTERLRDRFPTASITAIDVTPRLGRMFSGDASRVEFRQCLVEDIAAQQRGVYDLIVMSDVLHHVPKDARASLMAGIRTALAPDGRFVFKDWARTNTPIHWLCHASDRYLTGDNVNYLDRQELRGFVSGYFGAEAIQTSRDVAPWRNNMALLVKPGLH